MTEPRALIAAREDETLAHGHVLYGLVERSGKGEIVAAAGMVNVVGKKRYFPNCSVKLSVVNVMKLISIFRKKHVN